MSAQASSPEITFHPNHSGGTKKIWRTFWLLSVLTIIELAIGLVIYNMHKGEHPNATLVLAFKGLVCILTLAKAYYIVSIFMHLGDEIRNLIMTIVVPLCLFIWFIIAFLWDGNSWLNLRNRYQGVPAKTEQVAPAATEKGAKD
ncbi:MAG: cytochrome C oxidase subunit IV family protein [Chitinophagaceae bacterium]|nr:cytochrome C oxidase subunit IV family protein [Chitinophagaceae bacterium]